MKEFTPEEIKYLTDHADQDAASLMLQAGRFPHLPVTSLVQHIQARQKIRHKLPTWYGHPQVRYPATISVEQASSEKTAAYKAGLVAGETLIDLTGGFGVDACFFAGRFKRVFYVERQPELARVAEHNARLFGLPNIHFHQGDAEGFLQDFKEMADVIYLDPARRDPGNRKVHLLEDCEPDVLRLLPLLLRKGRQVLLKTSPMLDINLARQQLQHVERIFVVAVDNECKEVIYLLGSSGNPNPEIFTINFTGENQEQRFIFSPEEEEAATVTYAEPATFLYEPNAAILKAGGFRALAQAYHLAKLHRNSHLYTSETLVADFPGRRFRIRTGCRYNKKELLAQLPEKKANITVRNFPETVADIRKKTGIREGGSLYLFATTDLHQKPLILVCEKAD